MVKKYNSMESGSWLLHVLKKMIPGLIFPLIAAILGGWLLFKYTGPQIILYTDRYYQKIKDLSVGDLYIVNNGRATDKNITIVLDGEIPSSNFKSRYGTSFPDINNKGGLTYIKIANLQPEDDMEITFFLKTKDDLFTIKNFDSDSGNISIRPFIKQWWYLTKLQVGILLIMGAFIFIVGYLIALLRNNFFNKNNLTI